MAEEREIQAVDANFHNFYSVIEETDRSTSASTATASSISDTDLMNNQVKKILNQWLIFL